MNKRTTVRIPEAMQKSTQGLKVQTKKTPRTQKEQSEQQTKQITKNKTNPQDQKAKAKEMLMYLQNLRIYWEKITHIWEAI